MNPLDFERWIAQEADLRRRTFRQAVHLVLRAIANEPALAPLMVMKGGILLAIRYHSARFTRDIDFSTRRHIEDVDLTRFVAELDDSIRRVAADNEYGLALAVQSHALKPRARTTPTFPTLQVTVGYADRASRQEMRRLQAGEAPRTVQLDYSFNEWASEVEQHVLDGGTLTMYAYHDLIAEKLRAVLQQPIRQRSRFQDVYDLCLLFEHGEPDAADRQAILDKLRAASSERQVPMDPRALRDPVLEALSRRGYAEVAALVPGTPPDFESSFATVRDFYEQLPWNRS